MTRRSDLGVRDEGPMVRSRVCVRSCSVVGGALSGAAVGSVGGAIAGDAGKGAAAGAAMGGLIGGMRTRDQYAAQQEAYHQQQGQAHQASASRLDAYNRALNACLAGRGYTVR